MDKVFALVRKDFQQHGLTLLWFCASISFFPFSMLLVDRYAPSRYPDANSEAIAVFILSLTVSAFTPLLLGFWLIGLEKSKRTMLLLYMLPVSRAALVAAKELSAMLMFGIIYAANLGSIYAALRLKLGPLPYHPSLARLFSISLAIFLGTQVCMFLFITLPQKYAYQAPFLLIMLGRPAWLVFKDHFPIVASPFVIGLGHILIPACLLGILAMHWAILLAFERIDWTAEPSE